MTTFRRIRKSWLAYVMFACVWCSHAQMPAPLSEMAEALMKAATEAERTAILSAQASYLTPNLCDGLTERGALLYQRGQFVESLRVLEAARLIAEKLDYQKGWFKALIALGNAYSLQGNLQAALDIQLAALKQAEAKNEQLYIAALNANLCLTEQRRSNYERAIAYCHTSLSMAETLGNKNGMGSIFNSLGNIALLRHELDQAADYYQKSIALDHEMGSKSFVARKLGNLGEVYYLKGNYPAAIDYYLRSLSVAEEVGDKPTTANTLVRIGSVYSELGDYQRAADYGLRSLALSEAMGVKTTIRDNLHFLSTISARLGDKTRALEFSLKSLAVAQEVGGTLSIASGLMRVGSSYILLGNFSQANDYLERGLALAESIRSISVSVNGLFLLTQVRLQERRFDDALALAEKAITLSQQGVSQEEKWRPLLAAGEAHYALKQFELARQRFAEAISVIETSREQLSVSDRDQAYFLANRSLPYAKMMSLLLEQNQTAAAFRYAEQIKSRVLLDVLQYGKADIAQAMTPDEQKQEQRLRNELAAINTQLIRAQAVASPNSARIDELKAAQANARRTFETYQTRLFALHPELQVRRARVQPMAVEETAALLPRADIALLEYVVTEEATYLFVLTKATSGVELKAFPIAIKRSDLAELTNTFRQQLAARDFEYRESGRKLYNLLLMPARAQLRGKAHFVIVPDDTLWELPFQALPASANHHLIEEAAVSYAPSLTALRGMMARRKSADKLSQGLLALGNPALGNQNAVTSPALALRDGKLEPLPEAEREAKALGGIYGAAQSQVLLGAEAREDRFKTEAAKYGVLHFAAHGVLNDASPLYSHLALASGGADDGLLEAWEILKLDLRANLVVLSACETARGRYGAGEGVIGLSWAFFIAGAPTTVVSQWKVSSISTTQLLVEFHRQLKATSASRAGALRAAALKMLAAKETRHPFYWAGFVIVGDGY